MPLGSVGSADSIAVFSDFDGTLVEIAPSPDAVIVEPAMKAAAAALAQATGGAFALVTGRTIAEIDAFLSPVKLPVAGIHGLTRRSADGALHTPHADPAILEALAARLKPLLAAQAGLHVEAKHGALALHYRARPELADLCHAAMQAAVAGMPRMRLLKGKMVIEATPGDVDKGTAVAAFMAEPPFAGRRPIFIGDDVTDEDAFVVVNRMGGISVKVGTGQSAARHRLAGPAAVLASLQGLAGTAHAEAGR